MTPVRITLSRAKGSKLTSPNGLPIVKVDRTGKWGNPFKVQPLSNGGRYRENGRQAAYARQLAQCLAMFRDKLEHSQDEHWAQLRAALPELRGKNLACWCKAGAPCHADILLELANK